MQSQTDLHVEAVKRRSWR